MHSSNLTDLWREAPSRGSDGPPIWAEDQPIRPATVDNRERLSCRCRERPGTGNLLRPTTLDERITPT